MSLNHAFNFHFKGSPVSRHLCHSAKSRITLAVPARFFFFCFFHPFLLLPPIYSGGKNKVFQPHYARLSSHVCRHLLNMYSLSLPVGETAAALHLVQQHKMLVPLLAPHSPAHLTYPSPLPASLTLVILPACQCLYPQTVPHWSSAGIGVLMRY